MGASAIRTCGPLALITLAVGCGASLVLESPWWTVCVVAMLALIWGLVRWEDRVRRAAAFFQLSLLACVFVMAGAMLAPLRSAGTRPSGTACMSIVKQLTLAAVMYAADYDDRYPLAHRWRNSLRRYTKEGGESLPRQYWRCPFSNALFTYALNKEVAGTVAADQVNPERTPLIFDSDASRFNATGGAEAFARNHPSGRGTIGFADGHAEVAYAMAREPLTPAPLPASGARGSGNDQRSNDKRQTP